MPGLLCRGKFTPRRNSPSFLPTESCASPSPDHKATKPSGRKPGLRAEETVNFRTESQAFDFPETGFDDIFRIEK